MRNVAKRVSHLNNFVHLHGHTEYSILDGFSKVPKLIEKVKAIEQPALAISDHGSLSGVYKFYTACKKEGVNPIIGYEGYLSNNRQIKSPTNRQTTHLLLLAKNKDGYKNLLKIASSAASEGFYYKPRVDLGLLDKYKSGIICTTACIASEFNRLLLAGKLGEAIDHAKRLQEIFGDDFYIEIQNHGIEDQEFLTKEGVKIAKSLGVKIVATNDYHFVERADARYQDIIFCDQMKKSLSDVDRLKLSSEHYVKSREEMEAAIPYKDALDNTVLIAEQCDLNLTKSGYIMPHFENEEQEFDRLINQGIIERFEFLPDGYYERLDYEVEVIKKAKLVGYFLTVSDYIRWAKNNGLMVGPGRGSVAGSLVAYLLKIHEVDPIKYKLLFSRFYNAGRKASLPDIDTDFAKADVDKVIDYIVGKYGSDRVAQIGTFQKVAGRGAIKLICRVSNVPFDLANNYSSLVDQKKHKSLSDALTSAEFRNLYSENEQFKEIVDDAMAVEETIVSQGVHAAGILIADRDLTDVIPTRIDKSSEIQVSSWDMNDVEQSGLVKLDFLSIDTLDTIRECMELAGIEGSYLDLPLDDEKAYELISTTNNVGLFQLSSTGISKLANDMQVKSIEDIATVEALFRPGPLGSGLDRQYLKRRFGMEPVDYLHEKLEPALRSTYGILIFQEQITRICMDLAKFSEEEADELRKIIGKKLIEKEGGKEKLRKIGNKFVKSCAANDVDPEIAKIIWDQMQKFGGYGFNLSHATSYALITYYTAYLKAYHPVEFMTASLNSAINKKDEMKVYLAECKNMGIEVIPPNYTHAQRFTCKNGKILFGLGAIKGLSSHAYEKIGGRKFNNFIEFCMKVKPETDMLIGLIEAGALDSLNHNRRTKKLAAESLMAKIRDYSRKSNPKQRSLFKEQFSYKIEPVPEYDDKELASMELDRIGVYLGINPLEKYREFAEKYTSIPNGDDLPYNIKIRILCVPIRVNNKITKSNREMSICMCETLGTSIKLLIFPKAHTEFKHKLRVGVPILVHGKITAEESLSMKVENVELME